MKVALPNFGKTAPINSLTECNFLSVTVEKKEEKALTYFPHWTIHGDENHRYLRNYRNIKF